MKLSQVRDIDRVYVFKDTLLAGTISRTRNGSAFEYDNSFLSQAREENLHGVSFTLPLDGTLHQTHGDNLPPFFAGLLPEGRRLTALLSILKTSADDMFSLLIASGGDCVGDVMVSTDSTVSEIVQTPLTADLGQVSFEDLFNESVESTEYARRRLDISIPGVQPKISAEMISFPLSLKKRNKRYLLKLAPDNYPRLIENEHFFMQMASACGVDCAKTQIVHDSTGCLGLLVERFDRRWNANTQCVEKIHQEDACQFLGRYPQDKYRLSMRGITEGIGQYASSPIIESAKLIQLTAFCYLIANGDLHAKNISLIQDRDSSRTTLSPAYDLVSTLPYGDQEMALELEGRRTMFSSKQFFAWGLRCGVRKSAIESILLKLCESARPFVDRLGEIGLDDRKAAFMRRTMLERLELLQQFRIAD